MPHGLRNWTFNDVVGFLKEHGFQYSHTRGSHHFYFKPDNPHFPAVCVPFHGRRAIKPWDMRSIVRQSAIPLKEWLNG